MEDFSGHVINNKNKNHFTKDNSQKVLTPRAHQTKFDVLTFGGVCVCVCVSFRYDWKAKH